MTPLYSTSATSDSKSIPHLRRRLLQSEKPRPLVIVCPGGGYGALADHEGQPVAAALNEAGFHAAVLHYRLAPDAQHPQMIHDVQRAVRLVRHHAETWGVSGQVGVLGFSAGGHLASCAATLFDRFTNPDDDLADSVSARVDAAVLCYPVINMLADHRHEGSRRNLLGDAYTDGDLARQLSTDLQVTEQSAPAFLWHTADDPGVPMQHSLQYAQACREHGVPVELHVYESGRHGLGLAPDDVSVKTWFTHATRFLHRHLGS